MNVSLVYIGARWKGKGGGGGVGEKGNFRSLPVQAGRAFTSRPLFPKGFHMFFFKAATYGLNVMVVLITML